MLLKLVYSDRYDLNLGNHVFPSIKYRLVKEKLLREHIVEPGDFIEPPPASDDDIALVHHREYLRKLQTRKLSYLEVLHMEISYSPELIPAVWLYGGGSILAGRLALGGGVAVNVGGGFHHAYPDHGEGFCALNDFAVAIPCLQKERIRRASAPRPSIATSTKVTARRRSLAEIIRSSLSRFTSRTIIPPPSRPARSTSTWTTASGMKSSCANLPRDWSGR
jgi:hypothetical protein